ncbi:MAG: LacI family DNA-binding transcriptional regulator [Chloroflexi bacterium]|nr:LacI family DNA-binding transcriptional regulator [Chloroflexota bacterium]
MTAYIVDVAREAGVSVATVSRVLANTDYPVKEETRQRVLAAAERLKYQPNRLGRSLRVGHSSAVGVCATTFNNPTWVATLEGIMLACRAVNRQVQTVTTFSDPAEEQIYMDLFLQERVAGVISYSAGAPLDAYEQIQRAGAPVVVVNRPVPGLRAPLIEHDFPGGFASALRYLADRGHRRIGAVLPYRSAYWGGHEANWNGAFERLGIEPMPHLVRHIDATLQTDVIHCVVSELLALPEPPTAIYTAGAMSTLVAMRLIQFADDAAVRDIELVGTGDRRWEFLYPPSLPFVCLDSYGLGTVAAGMLNDLIDGKGDMYQDSVTRVAVSFVDATSRAEALPSGRRGLPD